MSIIPDELTLRESVITPLIGGSLFLAFLLVSIAKILKSDVFFALAVSNTKVRGLRAYVKESFPLNNGGSLLLIMNYLIAFGVVVYLSINHAVIGASSWLYAGGIPLVLLAWSLMGMIIIGWVIGERHVFSAPISMKITGAQLLGIVYLVVGVIGVLYKLDEVLLMRIVVWLFIAESIFRLLKSIAISLMIGVPWYYIILYFCTLEMLPLFVVYYFVLKDFIRI